MKLRRCGVLAVLGVLSVLASFVPVAAPASTTLASATRTAVHSVRSRPANVRHGAPSTLKDCVDHAEGGVSVSLKTAACAEVITDLDRIGDKLKLQPIIPTAESSTNPLRIIFASVNLDGTTPFQTRGFYTSSLTTEYFHPCEITIYPIGYMDDLGDTTSVTAGFHALVAHETVHCYQFLVLGDKTIPKFIWEGSATYLGDRFTGQAEPGVTARAWEHWFEMPGNELIGRSYPALGWYWLVANTTGDDLWSKMPDAWRAYVSGGDEAFIQMLGGDLPAVERAWGPTLVNDPDWGHAWTTSSGVGLPANSHPTETDDKLLPGVSSNGGSITGSIQPWAAAIDKENTLEGNFITISIQHGYASVHDSTKGYLDFTDRTFCTSEQTCKQAEACLTSAETSPALLTAPFTVAMSSGDEVADYKVTASAELTRDCVTTTTAEPPPKLLSCPKTPPPPCSVISTAELESIYGDCVSAIGVGPVDGSVEGCVVQFSHEGQVQQVFIDYSSKATSSTPTNECDREPHGVDVYGIEMGSLYASAESSNIGSCAQDEQVANTVFAKLKAGG